MKHSFSTKKLRTHTAIYQGLIPELVFAVMLLSIAAYLGISSFFLASNLSAFVQQSCVVLLFAVAVGLHRTLRASAWANIFRCVFIFSFISYLYSALAALSLNSVPWSSEHLLYAIDVSLGMQSIHTKIGPAITQIRWKTEILSLAYAAFIPYLSVSVFLHGAHRDAHVRELFLLSITLLYAIGFLGYLFVPAQGPIIHLAGQVAPPINGGFFHTLVTTSVDQAGGPHGAFPSIHVGATALLCLFDFRHGCRTRAWMYVPLVLLIMLATVLLRYHYVIDLMAGFAIAVLALLVAERWVNARSNQVNATTFNIFQKNADQQIAD